MIQVSNLTKNFDAVRAVNGISFSVSEGAVFGFIGPNGAGKTTTIRMISTLLDPSSGEAFIDGKCVYNQPDEVRAIIGYMPDYYGVYTNIEVWEFLDFFAASYRMTREARKKAVEFVMELTDLNGLKHKLVSTLSKGMKQRLCLAKTLLHDPKVLILDEPAAGLDPRARIEMRELLRELAAMGKTIFISSHILTELEGFCTEVGIVEQGKIITHGGIDTIHKALCPHTRLVIKVLNNPEKIKTVLEHAPLIEGITIKEKNTVEIRFQGEKTDIPPLLKKLLDADVSVISVEERAAGLEDLFMQITTGAVA